MSYRTNLEVYIIFTANFRTFDNSCLKCIALVIEEEQTIKTRKSLVTEGF